MARLSIRPLYRAALTKPLSPLSTPPSLLTFPPLAYSPQDDMLAVISGDGAVAVTHLDAPGESAVLVAWRRSPARHLAWKPRTDKAPLLLVADAAGRLTFWAAAERRVNVWTTQAVVEAGGLLAGVAWTKDGGAVVGVKAVGGVVVWAVPETLVGGRGTGGVVQLKAMNNGMSEGGVRVASVSAGGLEDGSVAVVGVGVGSEDVGVWHVVVTRSGGVGVGFEVKSLGCARVGEEDGRVEGVIAAPWKGCLFIAGSTGVLSRWFYDRNKGSVWVRQCGVSVEGLWAADEAAGAVVDGRRACDGEGWVMGERGRRRCYGISLVQDGALVVTSDAGGWTVWDMSKTGLEMVARRTLEAGEGSSRGGKHFWGVCLSRNGAVVAALDGKGCVEVSALVPGEGVGEEDQKKYVEKVAQGLVNSTSGNGLRGGWDLRAALSAEPGDRAATVFNAMKALSGSGGAGGSGGGVSLEKIENIQFVVLSSVDADSGSVFAARRLLDAAVKAILESAPEAVTTKMSASAWRDKRLLTNHEELLKVVKQTVSASSSVVGGGGVHGLQSSHFSAVPLADWIILLCIVWLRRYARLLSSGAPAVLAAGSEWTEVVAMDEPRYDSSDAGSVVRDHSLTLDLRRASVAACLLLALNDVHGDGGTEMRYMRLTQEQCADVVSAVWDVSHAQEVSVGTVAPAGASPQEKQQLQARSRMTAVATALSRHTIAAEVLKGENGLKIEAAERALGMRGAAVGAGFIMSRAREKSKDRHEAASKVRGGAGRSSPGKNTAGATGNLLGSEGSGADGAEDKATRSSTTTAQSLGTGGTERDSSIEGVRKTWLVESSRDLENEAKANLPDSVRSTDWCPFDVVTGRALPSWVPLRRCVLSGLLAAETTQPLPDGRPGQNSVMPWAARWAFESPLGGRWARVPSLDLDRFELLPAVSVVARSGGAVHGTPELHRGSAPYVSGATPPQGMHPGGTAVAPGYPPSSHNLSGHHPVPSPAAGGAPPLGVFNPRVAPPGAHQPGMANVKAAGFVGGAGQMFNGGTPSVGSQGVGAPSGPPSGSNPAAGAPRAKMSTASSTSALESTTSKGRKRGPGSGSGRRGGRKKQQTDGRSNSQMSGLNGGTDSMAGGAGVAGGGGTMSVGPSGSIGPSGSVGPTGVGGAASALSGVRSSDTRSTRTAATNASGGVDQVVGKAGRKPRAKKPTKAQLAAAQAELARNQQLAQQQHALQQSQMQQQALGRSQPNMSQGMMTNQQLQMLSQGPGQQTPLQLLQQQKAMGMSGSQFAHVAGPGMAPYDPNLGQGSRPGSLKQGEDVNSMLGLDMLQGMHGGMRSPTASATSGQRRSSGQLMSGGVGPSNPSPGMSGTDGSGMLMQSPSQSELGMLSNGQKPQGNLGVSFGQPMQSGSGARNSANVNNALSDLQAHLAGMNQMPQPTQSQMEAFARQNALQSQQHSAPQMRSSSPHEGAVDDQSVTSGQQPRPSAQSNHNMMAAQHRQAHARQQQHFQLQKAQLEQQQQARRGHGNTGGHGSLSQGTPGNMLDTESQTTAGSGAAGRGLGPTGSPPGQRHAGPQGFVGGAGQGGGGTGSGPLAGASGASLSNPPVTAGASRGMPPGSSASRAQIVWRGQLRIKGKTTDFGFPCTALRVYLSDKPPIQNAGRWPSPLVCDAMKLKQYNEVLPFISASNTQWYVRFMPEPNGGEQETRQPNDFISAMVLKRLAFEIECNEPNGPTGSLYIWAIELPNAGPSLLGVFRPAATAAPAAGGGIIF